MAKLPRNDPFVALVSYFDIKASKQINKPKTTIAIEMRYYFSF